MAKGTTSSSTSRHTKASNSSMRSKSSRKSRASHFRTPSQTELDGLRLRLIDLLMHEDLELDPVLAAKNVDNQLQTIGLMEAAKVLTRVPQMHLALLQPKAKGK